RRWSSPSVFPLERAAGDPLELSDVGAEALGESPAKLGRQLRLLRLAGARVVNDSLDPPAQRLGQAVEAAVEPAQPGRAAGTFHELEPAGPLARARLPLALELLRAE